MTFSNNVAGEIGGAIHISDRDNFEITNTTFQSNSAGAAAGAVAAYEVGNDIFPTLLSECIFVNNTCHGYGGALDTLAGSQEFVSCEFEDNSAGEKDPTTSDEIVLRMITGLARFETQHPISCRSGGAWYCEQHPGFVGNCVLTSVVE